MDFELGRLLLMQKQVYVLKVEIDLNIKRLCDNTGLNRKMSGKGKQKLN